MKHPWFKPERLLLGRTLVFVLFASLLLLLLWAGVVAASRPTTQALWVFSDEVTDPVRRQMLIERSAASGIDILYLSIYRSTPNNAGWRMAEANDLAALIQLARRSQIEVWAAYGAPDWPSLGCDPAQFPSQRLAEVAAYNASVGKKARLSGVVLDIEPPEPQSEADFQALLTLYQCLNERRPRDLDFAVAIRFFWHTPVAFPAGDPAKPVYQHILDLGLDHVIVMGYRDTAGAPCPANGLICLAQDEMAYASQLPGQHDVLLGLETGNCAPGCGPETVTFFEEGQAAMNVEAQAAAAYFARSRGFGGFAIHRYGAAYLGGAGDWPATNPGFPR